MGTVFGILLVAALGFGALTYYVQSTPNAQRVPDELRRAEPKRGEAAPPPTNTTVEPVGAKVLLPEGEGEGVKLSTQPTEVPSGVSAETFLARQVASMCGLQEGVVRRVEVKGKTAVVEATDGLTAGMGSTQEATFVKALQVGFGQFPEVDEVELRVEGQPVESLGHFEVSGPLRVVRASLPP